MSDKEQNIQKAFENRAKVHSGERQFCEDCFEHVVFLLKDKNGYEFSLGMKTILECLAFGAQNGDLPKIPLSWLSAVDDFYGTNFAHNKSVTYNDIEFAETGCNE